MTLETDFQTNVLIPEIERRFPDSMVLKNDPTYLQGIPDLTIINGPFWAMLEVKKSPTASFRPNQKYYVEQLNYLGFCAVVCPSNLKFVMDSMESYFIGLQTRLDVRNE